MKWKGHGKHFSESLIYFEAFSFEPDGSEDELFELC